MAARIRHLPKAIRFRGGRVAEGNGGGLCHRPVACHRAARLSSKSKYRGR
ncbi:hypothetical protein BMF35_a1617 [Aurantiacibacter gangjinensis]|nr:hypothetical protein BMF35_a1617 [Aurantiacibacter gangjinensis]